MNWSDAIIALKAINCCESLLEVTSRKSSNRSSLFSSLFDSPLSLCLARWRLLPVNKKKQTCQYQSGSTWGTRGRPWFSLTKQTRYFNWVLQVDYESYDVYERRQRFKREVGYRHLGLLCLSVNMNKLFCIQEILQWQRCENHVGDNLGEEGSARQYTEWATVLWLCILSLLCCHMAKMPGFQLKYRTVRHIKLAVLTFKCGKNVDRWW